VAAQRRSASRLPLSAKRALGFARQPKHSTALLHLARPPAASVAVAPQVPRPNRIAALVLLRVAPAQLVLVLGA
jgi:hypothetical protein